MLVLFYIIISIELITVFYNLIKFLIYKLNRKSNLKKLSSHNENFHINVLIPCYKEINVIKETLEHFKCITQSQKNIDIYVITTEKEKFENSSFSTTYEYLLDLEIFDSSQFHILNYPKITGIMADQLNYAMNEILHKQNLPLNRVYFSVYNADSKPDNLTFIELSQKIQQYNFPKIIQQYSNYFLNYNSQSFLMKGFSIYQTAFEFRNGLINNNISKFLYSHIVGHGLTIRADYITKINGFNSNFWCEDIYLTGLLHNNNERILSLDSLDNSENPEKLKIQIIQNAVWFKTASHHLKILKDIRKSFKVSLNGFIWLCHEFRATAVWFLMPIFLIYSLIYPLVTRNYIFLFLSICSYLIFVFTNYLFNLIVVNKKRFIKYIKYYFSICLAILFTGIGPLYSLFLKKKIKTER